MERECTGEQESDEFEDFVHVNSVESRMKEHKFINLVKMKDIAWLQGQDRHFP